MAAAERQPRERAAARLNAEESPYAQQPRKDSKDSKDSAFGVDGQTARRYALIFFLKSEEVLS